MATLLHERCASVDHAIVVSAEAELLDADIRLRSYLGACQTASVVYCRLPELEAAGQAVEVRVGCLNCLQKALLSQKNNGKIKLPSELLSVLSLAYETMGAPMLELPPWINQAAAVAAEHGGAGAAAAVQPAVAA